VRTRLAAQTTSGYYKGIGGTLQRIAADEGITGLYRGLGATLLQVVPSLALSFTVYETARSRAAAYEARHRTAAAATTPPATSGTSSSAHTQLGAGGAGGEWDLAQALVERDGGSGPTSSSSSSGRSGTTTSTTASSQTAANAASSSSSGSSSQPHGLTRPPPVSAGASLLCGCLSGVVTATVTFPLDVVRRRMQVEGQGRAGGGASYAAVIRQVVASRGLGGFYTGMVTEYCKVVPGVAIAYGTYEAMKKLTDAD